MDRDFIDDVARSLTASPTRRAVFGFTVGGLLGALHLNGAEAKRGKGKKKGKKKSGCATGQSCGGACCQGGFVCATAFNGVDQACCLAELACPGSQTGCCSSGLTCVARVNPPAGTPTQACVT